MILLLNQTDGGGGLNENLLERLLLDQFFVSEFVKLVPCVAHSLYNITYPCIKITHQQNELEEI